MPQDYIPYLRAMIGHRKCLAIGVTGLIVDEKGRILLEKRSDNGQYCLAGGALDLDETVTDGVKREVREETGINVTNGKLFMIQSGKAMDHFYPNGDVTQYVDIIFLFSVSSLKNPIAPQDKESTKVFFCEPDKLPPEKDFFQGSYRVIQKFLRKDFDVTID